MIEFFPVMENVWCLRRPSYLTCSYVIRTDQGFVFIDASMNSKGNDVRYALEKLAEPQERIQFCIVTHWHNDHSSGADYIEKVCKRPIYCHPLEGEKLIAPSNNRFAGKISTLIPEAGPLVLLKGLLKDGPAIRLDAITPVKDGDLIAGRFQIIETPGHTPGHIAVFDQTTKVLFAGDAIAVVRNKLRHMARVVTGDLDAGFDSMIKVLSFDATTICPGHRAPLHNASSEIARFREHLLQNRKSWPLLG